MEDREFNEMIKKVKFGEAVTEIAALVLAFLILGLVWAIW